MRDGNRLLLMRVPPGPPDGPLSQLSRLRRDFLGYLLDAAKYGDLVRLRPAPGAVIWLVNHPALVQDILVTRADKFHKSAMTRRMVGKFLGQGLVLSEGGLHRRQRGLMQPAFGSRRLAAAVPLVAGLAQRMVSQWRQNQLIDCDAEMTRLTLGVMTRSLFGVEGTGDQEYLTEAMRQFGESMAGRFRSIPLPDWLPTPRHRAERRAIALLDAAIVKLIEGRRAAQPAGDLLTMLLRAREEGDDRGMNAQQVRDELATLYFAGYETTAKLLTWALYLLTAHADVQERLRAEVDAVDDIQQMPYLDAVIKETLRLYPPAWVFDRAPVEDLELGGYALRKDSTIYLSPWVAHRDARQFTEPARFDPMRFMPGWETRISRYAYFPFGTGPRNCIGRGLAEINAKVALAEMLRQVRFERGPGPAPKPSPAATLRPEKPLRLKVYRI